ncbi:hypothetical protein POF50_011015 [Streptomyces sp. SL13]|uniref:Type IV secretion system protein n=1 Tax=Streptantibioticus silvisoli TaxID=2705255 RepID=A0AA90H343_9ACTN|nr:hypothetical protein [Streptantibioticus silvisoli]MDI5969859.1 hypothetical protein [Streptantibioticus silvisoli]
MPLTPFNSGQRWKALLLVLTATVAVVVLAFPAQAAPPQPAPSAAPTATTTPAPSPSPRSPAPASTAPAAPAAQPTGDTSSDSGGGISGWIADSIVGAINSFFKGVVSDALNPLLDLLGRTLLTTPTPEQLPRIGQLWNTSWDIVLASYALLVSIAGVIVMAHETVQTRYSIKQLATRIPLGFIAAAMSLFVCGQAILVANALSRAVMGPGVDENTASRTLRDIILSPVNFQSGGLYLVLLGGVLAGLLVALLVVYAVRVALTVILIAGAPIALMCHALPQTEGIARWWWKAFGGVLAIQVVQSLTLITAVRVFLGPGGFTMFGATQGGLVNLVVALALVYILFKTPFWVLGSIGLSNKGNFISSLARDYVVAKSMGMLRTPASKSRPRKSTRPASATPTTAQRRGRTASSSTLGSVPATGRPRRPLPPPGQPLFLSPVPPPDSASRPAERPSGPPPPTVFQEPGKPPSEPADRKPVPSPRPTQPPAPPAFRPPNGTPGKPPRTGPRPAPPAATFSSPNRPPAPAPRPSGTPPAATFSPPAKAPSPSPVRRPWPPATPTFSSPRPAQPAKPPRVLPPQRSPRRNSPGGEPR